MEFLLLAKVGFFIDVVVKAGYGIAGIILANTGYRYVRDYKDAVEKERIEVK